MVLYVELFCVRMEYQELTGYYTYRSFLNTPSPVDDFNKIKFAEAELFLILDVAGTVTGTLSFPPEERASEKDFMDINGTIKNWSEPLTLEFTGLGRPNTEIVDYAYDYSCSVAHTWKQGIDQRLSLTGTVLRAKDHGSGGQIAKAGATASFVAVKRNFTEPKDIADVTLIPSALDMLASRLHRLRHMVFHTIRDPESGWNILDEDSKTKIIKLGWGLDRPPFSKDGKLDLNNGAGEDFLFMHRKMITMIRDEYASLGHPYIESWKTLPRPDEPQFSYSEIDDSSNPGKKLYKFDPRSSGFMIPPAEPRDDPSIKFLKSEDYFMSVMALLERQFKSPSYLSALSLGTLGNLLEFTIHNQMHMRWSSISRDPKTGKPASRPDFDFDEKWDDPRYDYLGEFYSSHVNPIFWRLHGWVDDRIEDWFNAHEASQPGEVQRTEYKGVSWFKPGKWVQASNPFYWPEVQSSMGDDREAIDIMLKVLEIIRAASANLIIRRFGISSFMRAIESFIK
jgi:hypothetical protein